MRSALAAVPLAALLLGCASGQTGVASGTQSKSEPTQGGKGGGTAEQPKPAEPTAQPSDYTPAQLAGVWKAVATKEERDQAKAEGLDIEASLPTLTLGKDGTFIFAEPEGSMSGSFALAGNTLSLRVEMAFGERVDPSVYRSPAFEVGEKGRALLSPPSPDGRRLEFRRR